MFLKKRFKTDKAVAEIVNTYLTQYSCLYRAWVYTDENADHQSEIKSNVLLGQLSELRFILKELFGVCEETISETERMALYVERDR